MLSDYPGHVWKVQCKGDVVATLDRAAVQKADHPRSWRLRRWI
jgi:hypothetical protein